MNKIMKKINFKVILISIFLVAFQSIFFFLTKPFIKDPYILGSSLDSAIPYVPEFIWIYVFWYFMLFAVPYYIASKSETSLYKYVTTYIITIIISGIISATSSISSDSLSPQWAPRESLYYRVFQVPVKPACLTHSVSL